MSIRQNRQIVIKAGTSGSRHVWIGASEECYDTATPPLTHCRIHILRFTLKQAEVVIEMLRKEIDRQRGCIQSFDCANGDHSDACPCSKRGK